MNDCPNADIRDQLPDLLNDRLDAGARVAVMMHVDSCADCRAELELLRDLRGAMTSRVPRVDVASIVAALPSAATHRQRAAAPSRIWANWRVAAAVVLLAAGGTSVALLHESPAPSTDTLRTASVPRVAPTTGSPIAKSGRIDTAAPTVTRPESASANSNSSAKTAAQAVLSETVASSGEALGASGHLGDLDDSQLKALLDDIDHMEAVPLTEPEPVNIKLETRTPLPGRGRGR
ncbi:MAG TPA: zf-HC2 domain-containing protein [Gemmatimonadaceae bacterium]|nr:zf-HC2 domain-containing protein [Gemmatimonadaceae bacterium]